MRHIILPRAFVFSSVRNSKNALPIKLPINKLPCIFAILQSKCADTVLAVPLKTLVRLFFLDWEKNMAAARTATKTTINILLYWNALAESGLTIWKCLPGNSS
jgi:hypothetical protein